MGANDRQRAAADWAQRRLPMWRDAAARLSALEKNKKAQADDIKEAVNSYGEIARDLTVLRRASPDGKLTRYLSQVYARFHRALHRKPGSARQSLKSLLVTDVVDIAWSLRAPILYVTLLFIGSAYAGWWLVSRYPELAALFASESMIDGAERGELWTDDLLNVLPSSWLALSILTNNIAVSLFAACLGAFYGLGTLYIIGLNGLMLGSIFAMVARYELAGRLFEFVIAHGIVELSIICIAGAIGVSLGSSIARPGNRTRRRAFQEASSRAARLIFVCALFMAGAGIIEGYISPEPSYSLSFKVTVGISYFLVFAAVLGGLPKRLMDVRAKRADVRRGAVP